MTLIYFLLDPLAQVFILAFAAIVAHFIQRRQLRNVLAIFSFVWLWVVSCSPVPRWLIANLENQYPVIDLSEATDAKFIHVLGGGFAEFEQVPATQRLGLEETVRIMEGLRIYHADTSRVFITSGAKKDEGILSQAQINAAAILQLGVSSADTLQLRYAENTEAEAKTCFDRIGPQSIVLVTSANHMPRAMYHFKKAGLQPIPAPTYFLSREDPSDDSLPLLPDLRKIEMMDKWIHETIGLLYARIKS